MLTRLCVYGWFLASAVIIPVVQANEYNFSADGRDRLPTRKPAYAKYKFPSFRHFNSSEQGAALTSELREQSLNIGVSRSAGDTITEAWVNHYGPDSLDEATAPSPLMHPAMSM